MTNYLTEPDVEVRNWPGQLNGQVRGSRILLLDRSRLLTDVLRRRLLTEDDVESVGVASSAAEAARLLVEETYTVVVAAADLVAELQRAQPAQHNGRSRVPVVVLADAAEAHVAPDLIQLGGIAGWVTRDRSTDDLMKVVRISRDGDVCLPKPVLDRLIAQPRREAPQTERDRVFAMLTEREIEVLMLLEQGLGRAEIAAALHLSPNTVRTHIQRILRRLNVHSALAALALIRSDAPPAAASSLRRYT
jgi:DNA-binding NarL/FixJ family response regulator